MTAFFIGCSFTHGDDLDDPMSQAWPALVSKQKNLKFVNRAVSGGTNDRIVYQTVKNINNFEQFYIAWTATSRFTRYRPENNHEVNFNSALSNQLYQNSYEFQEYGKLHYAFWHNELYAFKIWLQQIVLLQRYFESHHKKYLMISTFDNFVNRWTVDWKNFNDSVKSLLCFDQMDDSQLFEEYLEIQHLQNQIDLDRFLGWGSDSLKHLIKDCPTGNTGHPLIEGHQLIADYILKHDSN